MKKHVSKFIVAVIAAVLVLNVVPMVANAYSLITKDRISNFAVSNYYQYRTISKKCAFTNPDRLGIDITVDRLSAPGSSNPMYLAACYSGCSLDGIWSKKTMNFTYNNQQKVITFLTQGTGYTLYLDFVVSNQKYLTGYNVSRNFFIKDATVWQGNY